MVTHFPPPSPSITTASTVSSHILPPPNRPARYQSRPPQPPSFPPSAFPPSPPSSYANSQYADTVVAPSRRRAPSVTSRATTSAARPHRHRRESSSSSAARTEVSQQSNAFPWFSTTGDTEIVIRDRTGRRRERKYLLHSLILAQNSSFFAAEFGDAVSRAARPPSAAGSLPGSNTFDRLEASRGRASSLSTARKWRYELDWGNSSVDGDDAVPVLVQVDPLDSGRPPSTKPRPTIGTSFRNLSIAHISSASVSSSSSSTAQRDDDLIIAYDNLFRIFYNHTPRLDTTNLATAYVECKVLLSLAALYSALPAVGPRVDHHLLRFQSRLWRQIAKYPPSYLKLGHLARSRAIFAEALIHVVGAWPQHQSQLRRGQVDDALVDLVEDKVDELEEVRLRIEGKLFKLSLTTSRGERVTPASSFSDFLTQSLFRQWLAEQTAPLHASILKDSATRAGRTAPPPANNGRVFRLISRAGENYLSHDELKKFLKLAENGRGYSRDGLKRFERRMDELKNQAKDVVKPLTRNFLELDQGRVEELGYLSCARIEERDWAFVWGDHR